MKKVLVGLGVVALAGALAAAAMAGPGWRGGWGGHMMGPGYGGHMMGPGYGGHMMGYGPWSAGPGYYGNLTPDQAQKLDQLRKKHWEETRELRQELFAKRQELWRLYAQPEPDQEAIKRVEKEIFDLGQSLREKGFAFQKEAREVAPELQGYGYGPGWGPGYGYGMGPGMMGPGMMRGPYAGGGPCWGSY